MRANETKSLLISLTEYQPSPAASGTAESERLKSDSPLRGWERSKGPPPQQACRRAKRVTSGHLLREGKHTISVGLSDRGGGATGRVCLHLPRLQRCGKRRRLEGTRHGPLAESSANYLGDHKKIYNSTSSEATQIDCAFIRVGASTRGPSRVQSSTAMQMATVGGAKAEVLDRMSDDNKTAKLSFCRHLNCSQAPPRSVSLRLLNLGSVCLACQA